jgi:hypothetical protein
MEDSVAVVTDWQRCCRDIVEFGKDGDVEYFFLVFGSHSLILLIRRVQARKRATREEAARSRTPVFSSAFTLEGRRRRTHHTRHTI